MKKFSGFDCGRRGLGHGGGMKSAFWLMLCLLLLAGGCFRNDVREITVTLPEAGAEDLAGLREMLLARNRRMPPEEALFLEVEILDVLPGLRVRFHGQRTAEMNVLHALRDAGFTANALAGDAEKRDAFREQLQERP